MIKFQSDIAALKKASDHILFVASASNYEKKLHEKLLPGVNWRILAEPLRELASGAKGCAHTTWTGEPKLKQLTAVILPDKVSRYNSPAKREMVYQHCMAMTTTSDPGIILVLEDEAHYLAVVSAISRFQRLYNRKTAGVKTLKINLLAVNKSGVVIKPSNTVKASADSVALAASLVDTCPTELNPKSFATMLKKRFAKHKNITVTEIAGEKLLANGLNAIHAVGRAATHEPRLVILDYKPAKAEKTIALIGKGLTYDSGGLSLKIGSMTGMKTDMGGAATVVGAFNTISSANCRNRVIAAVGLVENAIGPNSYKNDEIITMHSGKTVEVNNTDAEGRLVLADSLSYICRKYKPAMVIDAATLTGAQVIATGIMHGALVSNDAALEKLVLKFAYETGDLVVALPFAPEIYADEFVSESADMRNSVKNRANAQTSCAAQFVYSHIDDLEVPWAHIDMAGPVTCAKGLGTGFGVGLIAKLALEY